MTYLDFEYLIYLLTCFIYTKKDMNSPVLVVLKFSMFTRSFCTPVISLTEQCMLKISPSNYELAFLPLYSSDFFALFQD
jgi:hypothetical protein